MKFRILACFVLIASAAMSQELPTNPQTGLVSIKDSISIKDKSLQEVKEVMLNWGRTLLDPENLKAVYKLDNAKQIERIAVILPVGVLTRDKGGNQYLTNGSLSYGKTKTSGLNKVAPVMVSGGAKFGFYYTITKDKLVYEFTNLEYSHDMVHYGKYESEKPPQDNYNPAVFFNMSKKVWQSVRVEYFEKVKVLSNNLKVYAANLLASNSPEGSQSTVSYEAYKKISTGMSYNEVSKMFGDEGKELNNTSSQVGGKTITQQTIVWQDLDKSKSITVTFVDGKVTSKSQQNL
jgi:hypothetical protein